MKKLLLPTLLFAGLTGCSKKDPDPAPPPAAKPQLEGTWQTTTFHSIEKTPSGQVLYDETSAFPIVNEMAALLPRIHALFNQAPIR